jgi:type IV secretory pathway TraG/TraD family ATPase VirD4
MASLVIYDIDQTVGVVLAGVGLVAAGVGARWHHDDLQLGVDFAERAHHRVGPRELATRHHHRRRVRRHGWITDGQLIVGHDRKKLPVTIPIGHTSGRHTLVVGATGSGKTVTETWITSRLIEHGHAAIIIDPKGDQLLRTECRAAANRVDRPFLEWTSTGPCTYNPYGEGGASEVADKALAGELFTEPHYQRQAQRYLGHAVRTLQGTGQTVSPRVLAEAMRPDLLDALARELPDQDAPAVHEYLDSLDERQKRDLKGVRDRLSILAESDLGPHLEPTPGKPAIRLQTIVAERGVAYFRLDADRQPLVSQMLAAALISDLITLVADRQRDPVPTVVVVDEFAAVAAAHVARLFGRARSAGISLLLGTQELADLQTAADGLRDQILGNLDAVIAHRQNVPESAELIAGIAGTKPAWVTTEQTTHAGLTRGPSGQGTRRRGYEYTLHPSHLKTLQTGQAAVLTPGSPEQPRTAQMVHPPRRGNGLPGQERPSKM